MATEYEKEILRKHSTPGLRRNVFNRWEKRQHLADIYKLKGVELEKLLDELYPEGSPNAPPEKRIPPIELEALSSRSDHREGGPAHLQSPDEQADLRGPLKPRPLPSRTVARNDEPGADGRGRESEDSAPRS